MTDAVDETVLATAEALKAGGCESFRIGLWIKLALMCADRASANEIRTLGTVSHRLHGMVRNACGGGSYRDIVLSMPDGDLAHLRSIEADVLKVPRPVLLCPYRSPEARTLKASIDELARPYVVPGRPTDAEKKQDVKRGRPADAEIGKKAGVEADKADLERDGLEAESILSSLPLMTPAKRRAAIARAARFGGRAGTLAIAALPPEEVAEAKARTEETPIRRGAAASAHRARRCAESVAKSGRILDEGYVPRSRHVSATRKDDLLVLSWTPGMDECLGSADLRARIASRFATLLRCRRLPLSTEQSVSLLVGDVARVQKIVDELDEAVDEALDEPVLPNETEAFLSISPVIRRAWTRPDRLGSRGIRRFRKYGKAIEYHVHDRKRLRDIRDGDLVRVWMAEDGMRGKRKPPLARTGRAPIPGTDIDLVLEISCPESHAEREKADDAAAAGASRLADWIRTMTDVDPNGIGPIQELATVLARPVRVAASSKQRFDEVVAVALDSVRKICRKGVDRRLEAVMTATVRRIRDGAGYGDYPSLFPLARSLGRRLVLHVGPTNSGKTHAAVSLAKESGSSQILSPLRLLALEHFERLDGDLPASLVTGEEIRGEPDAPHSARTVEAADMDRVRDVTVVDEVQMLLDAQRGWAWTEAIVGAPSRTVVMTGPPECVPLIERLARMTGEPLDIVRFERRSELVFEARPLTLAAVRDGDALVAFSRKEVLRSRLALRMTDRKAAVVYGALGPEVRRREAARFSSGECGLLVSTDAIGMGLNLGTIRRIVFTATKKFDGVRTRELTSDEIRQIAGRAGRDRTSGSVAVMSGCNSVLVRNALASRPDDLAGDYLVRPSASTVRLTAESLGEDRIVRVLEHLKKNLVAGIPDFGVADMSGILDLARSIDGMPLGIVDKYRLACAPVEERSDEQKADFVRYAQAVARKKQAHLPPCKGNASLWNMEQRVKRLSLYLSIAKSFPDALPASDEAASSRDALSDEIASRLEHHVELEYDRFRKRRSDWYDDFDDD